jgi:hypothetical protein
LLHPDDEFQARCLNHTWDRIIDLGRAPASAYDRISEQTGAEVGSIWDYTQEIEDLYCIGSLFALGLGRIVDRFGLDWWDLLSLYFTDRFRQILLLERLAAGLCGVEIFTSRRDLRVTILESLLGTRVAVLESDFQATFRKARRYYRLFADHDPEQLIQIAEDKLGVRKHLLTRRSQSRTGRGPIFLLPSAYLNVSRTAVSYAATLPDRQFALVTARRSGELTTLPSNVRHEQLPNADGGVDGTEFKSLLANWNDLRAEIVISSPTFATADGAGVLDDFPGLLRSNLQLRDAWLHYFDSHDIAGCLSADESHPACTIPLLLAKKKNLPALSCHHGALDYQMSLKQNHADTYLAKSAMEQDYLTRVCRVPCEKVVLAGFSSSRTKVSLESRSHAPWMVFFSEPYGISDWRIEEVYRDLLPPLIETAKKLGLKLVFKLHPFESARFHRRMLRRIVGFPVKDIAVLTGPPTPDLWDNTRLAFTVQSSTAVECHERGIPVFLCSWLRDPMSGYVSQFAWFEIGRVLLKSEEISEVPRFLNFRTDRQKREAATPIIDRKRLSQLFAGESNREMIGTT